MQVRPYYAASQQSPDWRGFLRKLAFLLACLLLASALVSWVAANWPHASRLQKLAGAQGLLILAAVLAAWAALRGGRARQGTLSPAAALLGLSSIGLGALLALIGQIYQTGADPWQLFLLWAVLLLPWLLALPNVFIGLLFAMLLNLALGRYVLAMPPAVLHGLFGGGAADPMAALALLNLVLLAVWEACIHRLDDPWRVGPRLLAAAAVGATCLAAFTAGMFSFALVPVPLSGLIIMIVLYGVYTRVRPDLAIVAMAVAGGFVLLTLEALEWVQGTGTLVVLTLVMLALAVLALRHLAALVRAGRDPAAGEPWYIGLFRTVALGIVAIMMIAVLLMSLDLPESMFWVAGLAVAFAGALLYRSTGRARPPKADGAAAGRLSSAVAGDATANPGGPHSLSSGPPSAADGAPGTAAVPLKDSITHEISVVVGGAGLLLFVAGAYFADLGRWPTMFLLLGAGALLFAMLGNVLFRAVCALLVLGAVAILSLPDGGLDSMLFAALDPAMRGTPDGAYHAYLRVWLFAVLAVLALIRADRTKAWGFWGPLAWALILLAQLGAWLTPAPTLLAESMPPALWILWAALAVLPPLALAVFLLLSSHDKLLRVGAPLVLAVASIGWMGAPGISLALLWLLFGHALRRPALLVFGVAALLVYLGRFYFQIEATLLQKAAILAATGAWLLIGQALLRHAAALAVGGSTAPQVPGTGVPAGGQDADTRARARNAGRPYRAAAMPLTLAAGLLLALVVANTLIYQREQILAHGDPVILALAPVDPRSLMQGDYMALDFAVAREAAARLSRMEHDGTARADGSAGAKSGPAEANDPAEGAIGGAGGPDSVDRMDGRRLADLREWQHGYLRLKPDSAGVHQLVDIQSDRDPAPPQGEALMEYRLGGGQLRLATDAWFFPEGHAARYEAAAYGMFRVNRNGVALLASLLDKDLKTIPGP